MEDELKPCPFCGGPAELDSQRAFLAIPSGKLATGIAIYCVGECPADMMICRPDVPDVTVEQVIELWNRRADPASAVRNDDTHVHEAIDAGIRRAKQTSAQCNDAAAADQVAHPEDVCEQCGRPNVVLVCSQRDMERGNAGRQRHYLPCVLHQAGRASRLQQRLMADSAGVL